LFVVTGFEMTFGSQSYMWSWAVCPTSSVARPALLTFGRPTRMESVPMREISGSDTPKASVRLRMISIARSMSAASMSGFCGVGRAWKISSVPPFRSSPRVVFLVATMIAEPTISRATNARMKRLRRRLLTVRSSS
jgi:hypothetical protein